MPFVFWSIADFNPEHEKITQAYTNHSGTF